jgi:hypothetical protein
MQHPPTPYGETGRCIKEMSPITIHGSKMTGSPLLLERCRLEVGTNSHDDVTSGLSAIQWPVLRGGSFLVNVWTRNHLGQILNATLDRWNGVTVEALLTHAPRLRHLSLIVQLDDLCGVLHVLAKRGRKHLSQVDVSANGVWPMNARLAQSVQIALPYAQVHIYHQDHDEVVCTLLRGVGLVQGGSPCTQAHQ